MSSTVESDVNKLKTNFNKLVSMCSTLQTNMNAKISTVSDDVESVKTNFNKLVNMCSTLQTNLNSKISTLKETVNAVSASAGSGSGGSSGGSSVNISPVITQLNALVDYLEGWINTGNLTMNNIRSTVGQRLN